jgi:hypothetical protein
MVLERKGSVSNRCVLTKGTETVVSSFQQMKDG